METRSVPTMNGIIIVVTMKFFWDHSHPTFIEVITSYSYEQAAGELFDCFDANWVYYNENNFLSNWNHQLNIYAWDKQWNEVINLLNDNVKGCAGFHADFSLTEFDWQ